MDADAGFTTPSFTADLDVDGYIARTPEAATTKGMFLTSCAELARRAAPSRADEVFAGVTARRWTAFLDYPLRDQMRLTANAARLRWPNEPVREGLRRIGWTAYPTFAASMAGRVVLGVVGSNLEAKLSVLSRGMEVSVSHAQIRATRLESRHWRVDYAKVFSFLDSYHVGLLEGAARAHGETLAVRIRAASPDAATFDLRW
jgi:uncharacterized protein (TIGR02265 family)